MSRAFTMAYTHNGQRCELPIIAPSRTAAFASAVQIADQLATGAHGFSLMSDRSSHQEGQ